MRLRRSKERAVRRVNGPLSLCGCAGCCLLDVCATGRELVSATGS